MHAHAFSKSLSAKKPEIIIIGATYTAAGIALATNRPTCIVDSGFTFGYEFHSSFHQKAPRCIFPKTACGKNIQHALEQKGLLHQSGEIYVQPTVFYLSRLLYECHNTTLLFGTVITEIIPKDDGYSVTLFNGNVGHHTITVHTVIDTTSCGVFHTCNRARRLYALVREKGDIQNQITGLWYISVPVLPHEDHPQARQKLLNRAKEQQLTLIMMANEFAYTEVLERKNAPAFPHIPSDGFYNLLDALEGGAQYATENL